MPLPPLPPSAFDPENNVIEAPVEFGTTLEIQQLYNDIRIFEALSENMDGRELAIGTGKQSLGAGSQVGITLELINNWLVGFAARLGPAVIACRVVGGNLTSRNLLTGTNDVFDFAGVTLEDTTARFGFRAVQTGETLRNVTTGATATVVDVTDVGILTNTPLLGGSPNNQWNVGDIYEVDSFHPVFPTAFTHVTISQDTAVLALDLSTIAFVGDAAHIEVAYDGATVRMGVWLDRRGVTVVNPSRADVFWFNPDGTLLFSVSDTGPDALGHFQISQAQVLVGNTDYYVRVVVTDPTGTIESHRGVPTVGP